MTAMSGRPWKCSALAPSTADHLSHVAASHDRRGAVTSASAVRQRRQNWRNPSQKPSAPRRHYLHASGALHRQAELKNQLPTATHQPMTALLSVSTVPTSPSARSLQTTSGTLNRRDSTALFKHCLQHAKTSTVKFLQAAAAAPAVWSNLSTLQLSVWVHWKSSRRNPANSTPNPTSGYNTTNSDASSKPPPSP